MSPVAFRVEILVKDFFSYLNTLLKERKNDVEPHKEEYERHMI
jgi:hypothetical protein